MLQLSHNMFYENATCLTIATLFSKATATSKTFIVPKVFTFGHPDLFCLKANNLPFIHAIFHSSGSSNLAFTQFRKFVNFDEVLLKNVIFTEICLNKLVIF